VDEPSSSVISTLSSRKGRATALGEDGFWHFAIETLRGVQPWRSSSKARSGGYGSRVRHRACVALALRARRLDVVSRVTTRGQAGHGEIEALGRKAAYCNTDCLEPDEVSALVKQSIEWQVIATSSTRTPVLACRAPHTCRRRSGTESSNQSPLAHLGVRELLPHMLERGTGYLVHTSCRRHMVPIADFPTS